MRATFRALGSAAGASAVGVSRIDVEPGCRPGPVHQHASEEEIFFVLEGSGLAWIDGAVHEIGAGDTLVYLAGGPDAHRDRGRRRPVRTRLRREPRAAARAPAARGHGPPRRDLARGLARRPARARGRRRPARAARAHAAPAVQRRPGGRRARDRRGRRVRHHRARRRRAPPARCARGLRHDVVAAGQAQLPAALARRRARALRRPRRRRHAASSTTTRATLAEEHALRPGHCVVVPGRHAPRPRAARRRARA